MKSTVGSEHGGVVRFTVVKFSMLMAALSCAAGCASRQSGVEELLERPAITSAEDELSLTTDRTTLGEIVRELNQSAHSGIVLMKGLESVAVGPYRIRNATHESIIERLVTDSGCRATSFDHYTFIYPEEYEGLADFSFDPPLHPRYQEPRATLSFGAGTPLFSGLALLGHTLNLTLVADNAVAAAELGELHLQDVPLSVALEAMLKSARVAAASLRVESNEEYLFLASARNAVQDGLLLEIADARPQSENVLNKKVSVILPHPVRDREHFETPAGATPLGSVLDSLSQQLGVRVDAERGMERLPVNPAVMNGVRLRTALDLLIRQWPVAEFGYELRPAGVLIRRLERS